MCPSYMVTREEMHSTRGRSRLLFEMLNGAEIDGWHDEHVKEALDLCLACKGCKGECPMQVDMATYKAEFLSHYYEGKIRPPAAFAFGLIMYWSRFAAHAPWLANLMTQTPLLRDIAKLTVGIQPERQIPRYAPETFRHWFFNRPAKNPGGPDVILWADTFNNYFKPETARAAVEVLEDAGYHVRVMREPLCCGRPTFDYGMLDQAKSLLSNVLETMRPEIRAGTRIVGLEPSCVSVFRDELTELFPHDKDAMRLKNQTHLLSEFLMEQVKGYEPPKLNRKAVVHGHCHHKSLMGMGTEIGLLQKMGLDIDEPDDGCCGMAGAFGLEKGAHYDVSTRLGERVLMPRVREADSDTVIVANGFSCREQIRQMSNRKAMHLSEVLLMAKREGQSQPRLRPETHYVQTYRTPHLPVPAIAAAAGAALVGAAIGLGLAGKRLR
ncbi:MAG TPA: (Fe-S)-binding protein [Acidimicrobiia bacterium]|nr:(Fe-S)-binding protein [Acidimicrobiia bacterium]